MFERFTEKARRVVFFARYEAAVAGSDYIRLSHLLLGLLRERPALFETGQRKPFAMRASIEAEAGRAEARRSTSVDLPLDRPARRALSMASEEAERLHHDYIGTLHILLGIAQLDRELVSRHTGLDEQSINDLSERADESEDSSV